MYVNLLALSTVSIAAFYFLAFIWHLMDSDNQCFMTYMTSKPEFLEVNLTVENGKGAVLPYKLYAFSDCIMHRKVANMEFNGIPVLFVPGNSGSHKQARSLAALTLRTGKHRGHVFHMDFFSIGFNGEMSALYGGTLYQQAHFLRVCVQKIRNLYPENARPDSVMLVGHSMGGMIAMGIYLDEEFDKRSVRFILTLSTPHSPVLRIDPDLSRFYDDVNRFWNLEKNKTSSFLHNVTVISIGGGSSDKQSYPGLSYSKFADFNVLTDAIPMVKFSVDHVSTCWCNDLLKIFVDALHDSVDILKKSLNYDKNYLIEIFNYYLIRRSEIRPYSSVNREYSVKFNGEWETNDTSDHQYALFFSEEQNNTLLYINISAMTIDNAAEEYFIVLGVNMDSQLDWVARCHMDSNTHCSIGENLSHLSITGMAYDSTHLMMRSDEFFSRNDTHLVVQIHALYNGVGAAFDYFQKKKRFLSYNVSFMSNDILVEETLPGALFYSIELLNLHKTWQVMHIWLTPTKCVVPQSLAVSVFKVPWSNEDSQTVIGTNWFPALRAFVQVEKPANFSGHPFVEFYLDNYCQYSIRVKCSWFDTTAMIAVRYNTTLIAIVSAIIIATISRQFHSIHHYSTCPSFGMALKRFDWFLMLVLLERVATFASKVFQNSPQLDTHLLQKSGVDFILVPGLLYMVGYAITFVVSVLFEVYMKYVDKAFFRLAEWYIGHPSAAWARRFPKYVTKIKRFDFLIILAVSVGFSGSYGLILGILTHTFKMLRLRFHYSVFESNQDVLHIPADKLQIMKMDIAMRHSICYLWMILAMLYLPSFLHHVFHHGWFNTLPNDFSLATTFWIINCSAILWDVNPPSLRRGFYNHLSVYVFAMAVTILLIAQVNIYRISYLITCVFLALAGHALYGYFMAICVDSWQEVDGLVIDVNAPQHSHQD